MAKSNKRPSDHLKELQLLTVDEVADLLRRPRHSVYDLVRKGELGCVKDGPKLMKFRVVDVEVYIEARLQQGISLSDDPMGQYIDKRESSKARS